MAEEVKDFFIGLPWYMYLLLILCFGLMVASFVVPPLGAISPSVLQGVAIILGFAWLFYTTANVPNFIERGARIKATYGNASIEIGRNRKKSMTEEKEEDAL